MTPETAGEMGWKRVNDPWSESDETTEAIRHNMPLWQALGRSIVDETKSKDEAYLLMEAACQAAEADPDEIDNRRVDNNLYSLIDEAIEEPPCHW